MTGATNCGKIYLWGQDRELRMKIYVVKRWENSEAHWWHKDEARFTTLFFVARLFRNVDDAIEMAQLTRGILVEYNLVEDGQTDFGGSA